MVFALTVQTFFAWSGVVAWTLLIVTSVAFAVGLLRWGSR